MLLIHSSAMDPCDYCHFNHHIALTPVQDRPEDCVEGIVNPVVVTLKVTCSKGRR